MYAVEIAPQTLERYNRPGPRYTSYPTVPYWEKTFGENEYRAALQQLGRDEPLSLYVHLPFCAERCHYCGCNATVTRREAVVDSYLDRVEREIGMVLDVIGTHREVVQLHWGGGTPNFLTSPQIERLIGYLHHRFTFTPDAEISIEVDPRIATRERLTTIRNVGFNRISLGVQDFEPIVQEAIGRIQPEALTRDVYGICRDLGFESVNLDLVYGLPGQTRPTFQHTLDTLIELAPDRIACFSYAHLPQSRPNQKYVDVTLMPTAYEKFGLFQQAVETLSDAGYDWVGMDHFAVAEDELSQAAREHRLHRNFMGYTTRPATQMLAFGSSSIGDFANTFVQNDAKLGNYQRAIDAGTLPIVRGMQRNTDDELRREVITHLMCNLELPYDLLCAEHNIDLRDGFATELERLAPWEDEGFITYTPRGIEVTTLGRYFVRLLGMEFDSYLHTNQQNRPTFSATV